MSDLFRVIATAGAVRFDGESRASPSTLGACSPKSKSTATTSNFSVLSLWRALTTSPQTSVAIASLSMALVTCSMAAGSLDTSSERAIEGNVGTVITLVSGLLGSVCVVPILSSVSSALNLPTTLWLWRCLSSKLQTYPVKKGRCPTKKYSQVQDDLPLGTCW